MRWPVAAANSGLPVIGVQFPQAGVADSRPSKSQTDGRGPWGDVSNQGHARNLHQPWIISFGFQNDVGVLAKTVSELTRRLSLCVW